MTFAAKARLIGFSAVRGKPCLPKLVVAFFYARFDVVLAVSRPETADLRFLSKAFPARSAGSMQ